MGACLITLAQAKHQLQMVAGEDDRDSQIILKMEEASDIIVGYLKSRADPNWTDRTVPPRVRAAILLVFDNLWHYRGETDGSDPISPAVQSLLMRDRDPALA